MSQMGVTRMRLERLGDERDRTQEKLNDLLQLAEEEQRALGDFEQEQSMKYRAKISDLDEEIMVLAADIERDNASVDISKTLRTDETDASPDGNSGGPRVYRTFAQYARDRLIVERPDLLGRSGLSQSEIQELRDEAGERIERTLQNTTSSTVAGLIVPTYMTQIMDIISNSRPVVASGRSVPLDRGTLYYPSITTRPTVVKQSSEKSEGGTIGPVISASSMTADTYLGAANISWQAVNWSNPDILTLYFDLAAEAYARQTESAACDVLEDAAIGTVGTASGRLGTAGTESFTQWRAAVAGGLAAIYSATGGRHRTNTLYLSADRFFALATIGTDAVTQLSPVGNLDVGSMSGNFFGLRVVGSYGFDTNTAIVGDASALLIGENAGSPVEMRVVEPSIGGWEVGLIGAFQAAVFDVNRFYHLGTHL